MKPLMVVLAAVNLAAAGFVGLVGSFADGGDAYERLLLFFHSPAALLLLTAVVVSKPIKRGLKRLTASALLLVVSADVYLAYLMFQNVRKGDPELIMVLAAVPAVGLLYVASLRS